MTPLAMKDLLEAGVHFGHQTKRWNPKMKPFIFGERSGIYILDLGKTVKHYREAEDFVRQLAAEGKSILFVGTKRQAQDVVAEEATRCGMYYVNERWLGGLLTNFTTIQRSLSRLRDLEAMSTDGGVVSLRERPPTPPMEASGRLCSTPAMMPSLVTMLCSCSTLAWSWPAFSS